MGMLGLGISAAALPVAISRGAAARRAPGGGRALGVVGLMAGLFAALLDAPQVASALAATRAGDAPQPRPRIACDCGGAPAVGTLELRLATVDASGPGVSVRGSDARVTLAPEALVSLADVLSLAVLRAEPGHVAVLLTLRPEAAERLERGAAPGSRLATLVNGDCVSSMRVQAPLRGSLMLDLALSDDEACALKCASERQVPAGP